MKRTIGAFMLALLLPAGALAYSPSDALGDLNNFLREDDQYGINYINSQLKQTKAEAHENWDDRAALYDFTFYAPVDRDIFCELKLSSMNTADNDYMGSCTADDTPLTELIDDNPNITPHKHIYRVDLLMRDLVPALMADEQVMTTLDAVLGEDAQTSLMFNLSKNDENHLIWTVEFTDELTDSTYMVKTSAQTKEDPTFMMFHKATP